ncbi:MAG: SAM-dependent chlorinase/fluorinase [Chitinispirillales bacterium]|jgi:S-adenosylmethionine hydrolase|nr:SAM-dependent chlorinase/fluorinase [Chitinispirillales bacterium]
MSTIALITDFGTDDWFAGELKGTVLSINPQAVPVDLTHAVQRGYIREAAFILLASYRSFPENTVFLSAVDYGSTRTRVIAAKTASHIFLAPDNGLLSWVLRRENSAEVREVNIDEYLLPSGCATFPARDLLAPLAAGLSDWLDFGSCGEETGEYVALHWPEPELGKGTAEAAVIYVDRFGNAITSISPREVVFACGDKAACILEEDRRIPIGNHYSDVPIWSAVAYPGSAGLMEIGVNGGSAEELLGLDVGSSVCFTAH